ncbi:hypothetical protein KI387_034161, partial [Taxus chinensis]
MSSEALLCQPRDWDATPQESNAPTPAELNISSVTPNPTQPNGKIITIDATALDFNLGELVEAIDIRLAAYHQKQLTGAKIEERKRPGRKFSKYVRNIRRTISETGDIIRVAAAVVDVLPGIPMVGVIFLLVETVSKRMVTIENNQKDCFKILNSMNDLAKIIMELQPLPNKPPKVEREIEDSYKLVMEGAIKCYKMLENNRFLDANRNKLDLEELGQKVEEMRNTLHVQLSLCTFRCLRQWEYTRTGDVDQGRPNMKEYKRLYDVSQDKINKKEYTGPNNVDQGRLNKGEYTGPNDIDQNRLNKEEYTGPHDVNEGIFKRENLSKSSNPKITS